MISSTNHTQSIVSSMIATASEITLPEDSVPEVSTSEASVPADLQTARSGNKEKIAYLSQLGVVPLVTIHNSDEAVPLAHALSRGGIPVAEVTFRSDAAEEAMRQIHHHVPGVMLFAGTVHSVDQARRALDAGCVGIITPAFQEDVVDWCLNEGVLVMPGIASPTEVEMAWDRGLRYVKFFPAAAYGGVKTLRSLAGPYSGMHFLPTGGVGMDDIADYLSLPNVFAVGGSFAVPSALQEAHDWDGIAERCRHARAIAQSALSKD
jgi:2-dehydro-3-deoxyphosphogluconate aldolase/(4S)-4-hydroxy-2-oxoglutarate aldolase